VCSSGALAGSKIKLQQMARPYPAANQRFTNSEVQEICDI
jgi:hypothetical protein